MPITRSAIRQVRVSARKNKRNRSVKSAVKTNVTKAKKLISSGEADTAKEAVRNAVSSLDVAAEKGIIHENNAARRKSRLMKKLNRAAVAATAKKEAEGAK